MQGRNGQGGGIDGPTNLDKNLLGKKKCLSLPPFLTFWIAAAYLPQKIFLIDYRGFFLSCGSVANDFFVLL